MTREQYVDEVMARLPEIPDKKDFSLLQADAGQHFDKGWELSDSVAYLRCMEEVNPELEEGIALARMAKIYKKYDS